MIPRLWEAIWRGSDPASIPVADRSNTPRNPLILKGRKWLNFRHLTLPLWPLDAINIGDPKPGCDGGRGGSSPIECRPEKTRTMVLTLQQPEANRINAKRQSRVAQTLSNPSHITWTNWKRANAHHGAQ